MKRFLLLIMFCALITPVLCGDAFGAAATTEVVYRVDPDAETDDYSVSPKIVNFIENALADANSPGVDDDGNELDPYTNIRIELDDNLTGDYAFAVTYDFTEYEKLENIIIDGKGRTIAITNDSTYADMRHFLLNVPNITLTLENITLDGAGIGGGIEVSDGTLIIGSGAAFRNNVSSTNGGALSISGGTVDITAGTFSANSATNGGAISISGGTVSFSGTPSFSGNRAENLGGAVYYSGSSTFTLTGTTFDGSESPNSAPYGGALALSNGTVQLTDCTFTKNSADIAGGAVYVASGTLSAVSGNAFTYNTAVNGGAIALADSSSAVLSVGSAGMTIGKENSAAYGGGLYLCEKSTLACSGTLTLSGNTADYGGGLCAETVSQLNSITTPLVFSDNTADYGGGLYIASSSSTALTIDSSKNFTFSGNSASYEGGAIYTLRADVLIDGIDISGNSNNADNGGGFLRSGGSTTINNATVSGQTAKFGGAVYSAGDVTISNSSFTQNRAETDTDSFPGGGGAVYVEGSINITSSDFSSNYSTSTFVNHGGGAIFVSGDAVIEGSKFTNNTHSNSTASNTNGGGAIFVKGSLTVNASQFISNQSAGNGASRGGAIYADTSAVTITDTLFQSNKAVNNGGAVTLAGYCTSSISSSTFTDNVSTGAYGGAIYAQGIITITDNYFYMNRSYREGGAVYFDQNGNASNPGTITIESTMFTQNSAGISPSTIGRGGALFLKPDTAFVNRCTFSDNQSSTSNGESAGGAVYLDTSSSASAQATSVMNCVFMGNQTYGGSTNYGGGLYTRGEVSLIASTLVENSAGNRGGGLFVDTGTLIILASVLVNNTSDIGKDVYAEGTITSRGYNRIGTYGKGGSNTSWLADITTATTDRENSAWGTATFFGDDAELVNSDSYNQAPTIGCQFYDTTYLLSLPPHENAALTDDERITNKIPYDRRFTLNIPQLDIWGVDRFKEGLALTIGAHHFPSGGGGGGTEPPESYDIESITMSGIPNTLKYPGQTASLIAMIRYTNHDTAYGVPASRTSVTLGEERVNWSSSNPTAVHVDENGNITAIHETSNTTGVTITVSTVRSMISGQPATASRKVIVTDNNGYDYMNISPTYWNYFVNDFLPNIFEYDISAAIADKNPNTVKSSVFQRNFSGIWPSAKAAQITDLTTSTPTFSAATSAPAISGLTASKRAGVNINYQGRSTGDMLAMIYSWTFKGEDVKAILGYDMTSRNINSALAKSVFDALNVSYAGISSTIPVLGSGGVSGSDAYDAGALELSKADGGAGLRIELTAYVGNMTVTGNGDGAQIVRSSGTNKVLVVPDGAADGAIAGAMWMYQPANTSTNTNPNPNTNTNTNPNTNTNTKSSSGGGGGGGCNALGMGLLGAMAFFLKRKG